MVRHVHILVLSTVVVLVAAGGAKLFSQAPGPRGPGGGGPGIGLGGDCHDLGSGDESGCLSQQWGTSPK